MLRNIEKQLIILNYLKVLELELEYPDKVENIIKACEDIENRVYSM